ncbi:M28 family peptidase [Novosphingobium sp. 1949]|uniref:M28 family peptidase n=1 Tax=Novosphingobium organovorum TaxID=2930092 RepID=A0ABT0BC52_9SPHN|nr:M28 family peptidase [Novosphingobium organovorum]MCJ2182629.1 M28 family peptidase [Novosphingobium organovorum]
MRRTLRCALPGLATAFVVLGAAGGSTPVAAASRKADAALEARLRHHIEVLASDDFEGREPGTAGEAKTLRYLGRQWFDIGLVSGTNDPAHDWFAPVTVLARAPATSSVTFYRSTSRKAVNLAEVLVLTSGKRALVRNAPLLFVGDLAPEALSRTQLAGRVVVVLDTLQDGAEESAQDAKGDAPAEGKRQSDLLAMGASAVLTVLDGSRSFAAVVARRNRPGYALAQDSTGGDLEAFISREAMSALLKGTPDSLPALEAAAAASDFQPMPLALTVSLEATTKATTIHTHNLIGKLPGLHPEAGAVLFVAHWDHFGVCAEPPAEDTICNGAVDNASGVAALTEIARALAKGPPLDRDVYFLSTTAEEYGLLGAQAFAESPPIPLDQIVAAFNIDSDAIAPRGTPFVILGKGMTGLDADIAAVARKQRLRLRDNPEADAYLRRQDGWALLQHDVPALMVTTAYGDLARMKAFYDTDYHRPSDDLSRPLELGGEIDDVHLLTALGRWFGDARNAGDETRGAQGRHDAAAAGAP